ncbi:MAG TPA: SDR family oxidoreductase [Dehalococcoidales bacterium]|nr:SDR family oxidoreductase [Dehalococcoidales bacterium]
MCPVLKDKVAVITGAGRGLGKAFALKYAEEGARLLLPDISLERAEGTVKEIKAKGGRAAAMMTDISSEEATKEMADRVMELYGRVDILVNNAAIWYGLDITPWDAWTVEDWERILKVNVIGTWLCCKAVAPLMARGGGGKIINIASNVAQVPAAQVFLPYACSKGTVYTLTHALARALGPSKINVNAIAPGYTASEASLNQRDAEGTFKLATSEQTFQRREQPEDLLGAAVFLASAASDFMTGQVLYVDGGTVML